MPVFSKIALYPTPSPSAHVEPLRNQPLHKAVKGAKIVSKLVQSLGLQSGGHTNAGRDVAAR